METGGDIIRFTASGDNSEFLDEYSLGYRPPGRDQQRDLTASFEVVNGEVKWTATRKLDTGDLENDYVIPLDDDFNIAWAINSRNPRLTKHNIVG